MTKYIVTGGTPLHGTVQLHGAKNAGFKAMIAALLANSPSTICGLGLISEIDFARLTITSLGGTVKTKDDPHCLEIDPRGLQNFEISPELSSKSRFSPMYVGPLLAKFKKAVLPAPGGDTTIGKRPINRWLDGLKALGATVDYHDGMFFFEAKNGLKGTTFTFDKNTHNGTEMLVMMAIKAEGQTIINNAAAEPEVDDLIEFLNLMGGRISRVEPRTIRIEGLEGQEELKGMTHKVMKDRNEAVTFACAALATKGEIFVEGADSKVLGAFLEKIGEIRGIGEIKDQGILFRIEKPLSATNVVAAPYPGFMTDWQPLWTTLMTQAQGEATVHETVYERRFDYVPALVQMGAKIDFFEPEVENPDQTYNFNLTDDSPDNKHAIKITGPTPLIGGHIEVNDVRSGATALLAGLIAQGQTTVVDPRDQIKRGYENLPEQLMNLGAKIQIQAN